MKKVLIKLLLKLLDMLGYKGSILPQLYPVHEVPSMEAKVVVRKSNEPLVVSATFDITGDSPFTRVCGDVFKKMSGNMEANVIANNKGVLDDARCYIKFEVFTMQQSH